MELVEHRVPGWLSQVCFNLAIFTPPWFARHEILPRAVVEYADIQVAHRHLVAFSTEWLQFRATYDRFCSRTQQDLHVGICDLVVRVFKELLSHSPVKALGVNRGIHFRALGATASDRTARLLAPVGPWGEWTDVFRSGGSKGEMGSLTMRQIRPEGRP